MNILRKINWFLDSQVGINVLKILRAPYGLGMFAWDLIKIKLMTKERIALMPCINDWYEGAGAVFTEYFWQDLIFAKLILDKNPMDHVDIGSRIDGFVAHLATRIQVNVLDVRPLNIEIPNISFKQADILNKSSDYRFFVSSVSCLHTIEHFGLGRYGDKVEPDGLYKGLETLLDMVKPGGYLYLSTPLGEEIIQFNANRVSCPYKFFSFINSQGFIVERFIYFFNDGYSENLGSPTAENLKYILECKYCLVGAVLQKP
jgi:hypothetical protein